MKKHIIISLICFLITYAFLFLNKYDAEQYNNKNEITYTSQSKLINEIQNTEEIQSEVVESEKEVFEDSTNYVFVAKSVKRKRPAIAKPKKIVVKLKFRVQSARSIIGDEGFANI